VTIGHTIAQNFPTLLVRIGLARDNRCTFRPWPRNDETRRLYEQIAKSSPATLPKASTKWASGLPSERELAQTFAVSRPTIREAIIALELDGWWTCVPAPVSM